MQSGIVVIRNLKTDKVFLFYAQDIEKECIDMRFKLDLGMHPCAELQKDYETIGLEVFRFDTLEVTENRERLDYWKDKFPGYYN